MLVYRILSGFVVACVGDFTPWPFRWWHQQQGAPCLVSVVHSDFPDAPRVKRLEFPNNGAVQLWVFSEATTTTKRHGLSRRTKPWETKVLWTSSTVRTIAGYIRRISLLGSANVHHDSNPSAGLTKLVGHAVSQLAGPYSQRQVTRCPWEAMLSPSRKTRTNHCDCCSLLVRTQQNSILMLLDQDNLVFSIVGYLVGGCTP